MTIPGSSNPLLLAGSAAAPAGYNIERSVRFNSADSAYLSRTPASAGNRKTWTWAGWVKRSALGTRQLVFGTGDASLNYANEIEFNSSDQIRLVDYTTTTQYALVSTQVFRDVSAWSHIVLVVDTTQVTAANRVKVFFNGVQITAFNTATYPSQNLDTQLNSNSAHGIGRAGSYTSLYFSGYLADIHFIDGQALDPTSFGEFDSNGVWQPKAYTGSYDNLLKISSSSITTSGTPWNSAREWDDLFTNTLSDAVYAASGSTYTVTFSPALPVSSEVKITKYSGQSITNSTFVLNGSVTRTAANFVNHVDTISSATLGGTLSSITIQTLSGTDAAGVVELTVDGKPVRLDTINGNGFHLPFSNNSTAAALGTDTSGNSNTWTVNNISVKQVVQASYNSTYGSNITAGEAAKIFDGDLTTYGVATGDFVGFSYSGTAVAIKVENTDSNSRQFYIQPWVSGSAQNAGTFNTSGSNQWSVPATTTATAVFTFPAGYDGFARIYTDGNSGSLRFYDVRTAQSEAAGNDSLVDVPTNGTQTDTGVGGEVRGNYATLNPLMPGVTGLSNGNLDAASANAYPTIIPGSGSWYYEVNGTGYTWDGILGNWTPRAGSHNFGQRPFNSTAPSGFKALCTANLPTPTIADGSTAMDVVLDTGANILTSAQAAISGSADLLWIKDRANTNNHQLIDTVRGGTATLQSNTTAAETTYSAPSGSSVAWTWDAGSSTVTNTDGSITSQVRANPSAGFSIVTYTGNGTAGVTVGHGLNVAPEMIIIKNRDQADAWQVYHAANTANPETDYLVLNGTAATADALDRWNDTAPGASVFTLGDGAEVNTNTEDYVAYCFAPVEGYSAFGSYVGNNSADGPFVYCGFRPRWVMIKASSASGSHWMLFDTERSGFNVADDQLYANLANAEVAANSAVDFLSNGFKPRADTFSNINGSGITYIYAAFAEHPFSLARAR